MPGASAADDLDPGDEPAGAVTLDKLHPAGEQPVTKDRWSQSAPESTVAVHPLFGRVWPGPGMVVTVRPRRGDAC